MAQRAITLRSARMLSPKVRELTFDPGAPFPFSAGQWVSLKFPLASSEVVIARSYSIASAPRADHTFDLAVTLVQQGPASTLLHAMSIGDEVQSAEPMGFFTLPPKLERPLLLVGTGTGVAPLRAMIQSRFSTGLGLRMYSNRSIDIAWFKCRTIQTPISDPCLSGTCVSRRPSRPTQERVSTLSERRSQPSAIAVVARSARSSRTQQCRERA